MSKKKQKPEEKDQHASLPTEDAVERSLLGIFILDNERFYEATASGLKAEYFHFDWNRKIYMAIGEVLEAGVHADLMTLAHYLDGQGELAAAGDVAYISDLIQAVPDKVNVAWHVKVLRESSMRRDLFRMGDRLSKMAADPSDPIELTLTATHEELLRLQGDAQQETIPPMSTSTAEVLDTIEQMMSYHPDRTIGVPFGLAELDETTSGIRKGQFVVVGGFPKSGKTSFAIDLMRKAVRTEFPIPVGFFSREMRRPEVIERLLSQESEIPYSKIRKPMHMSVTEFKHLQRLKNEIDKWPLYIDDSAVNIHQIIPRIHMMIRRYKIELAVLDYLQIVEAAFDKEYERVSFVANSLTYLAKSTGVPVLALSQLTPPEGRKGDMNIMPNSRMLRSSGQIEQNAHVILFTYHPVDKETADPTGEDVVIIGAQRAGPTGRCKCYFNTALQRWEERGSSVNPPAKQEKMFQEETNAN